MEHSKFTEWAHQLILFLYIYSKAYVKKICKKYKDLLYTVLRCVCMGETLMNEAKEKKKIRKDPLDIFSIAQDMTFLGCVGRNMSHLASST